MIIYKIILFYLLSVNFQLFTEARPLDKKLNIQQKIISLSLWSFEVEKSEKDIYIALTDNYPIFNSIFSYTSQGISQLYQKSKLSNIAIIDYFENTDEYFKIQMDFDRREVTKSTKIIIYLIPSGTYSTQDILTTPASFVKFQREVYNVTVNDNYILEINPAKIQEATNEQYPNNSEIDSSYLIKKVMFYIVICLIILIALCNLWKMKSYLFTENKKDEEVEANMANLYKPDNQMIKLTYPQYSMTGLNTQYFVDPNTGKYMIQQQPALICPTNNGFNQQISLLKYQVNSTSIKSSYKSSHNKNINNNYINNNCSSNIYLSKTEYDNKSTNKTAVVAKYTNDEYNNEIIDDDHIYENLSDISL